MLQDKLHELIGEIYDAATLPEIPLSVIEGAAALTGSTAAMADTFFRGRVLDSAVYGADQALRMLANEYMDDNLFAQKLHLACPGRATHGLDLVDADEWRGNRTMHEFLIPADTVHLLHLTFFQDENRHGGISLWRGLQAEPHGQLELELGHVLSQHLRRALQFGLHFREAAAKTQRMEAAIDALAAGCMLIDAAGRLVKANREAMHILSEDRPLRLVGGRIEPVLHTDRGRWLALLTRLKPTDGPPTGGATLLEGSDPLLVLYAVPLRPAQAEVWGVSLGAEPLGLVMLQRPAGPRDSAPSLLRMVFGLTASEAELAAAMGRGQSLRDYAERRGRSLNTVKTHLKSVFAKTGARRQSDLVRVIAGISGVRLED